MFNLKKKDLFVFICLLFILLIVIDEILAECKKISLGLSSLVVYNFLKLLYKSVTVHIHFQVFILAQELSMFGYFHFLNKKIDDLVSCRE